MGAQKLRAHEWVLKTQKHVQMKYILSEPAGMSIIIINSRNPAPTFCSVFSAKNPTVNDVSGVTMLSVRSCSRGGYDFWCAGVLTFYHTRQIFLPLPCILFFREREYKITERLERREERALIHSRLWSHTPQHRALECDQFGRTCDLISQGCD